MAKTGAAGWISAIVHVKIWKGLCLRAGPLPLDAYYTSGSERRTENSPPDSEQEKSPW